MFIHFPKMARVTPILITTLLAACAGLPRPPQAAPTTAAPTTAAPTTVPATAAPTTVATDTPSPTTAPTLAPTTAPTIEPTAALTATSAVSATAAMTASTTTSTTTAASTSMTATMITAVNVIEFKKDKILADESDRAMYIYTKDKKDVSECYEACAQKWPPVLTDGKPQAGTGVEAKLLGNIKRKDGEMQLTYKGMPLYYYAADKAKGDVKGQALGEVWFVITPAGAIVKK